MNTINKVIINIKGNSILIKRVILLKLYQIILLLNLRGFKTLCSSNY